MKTTNSIRNKTHGWRVLAIILASLLFLSGCVETSARVDLVMARANGTIEKYEKITGDELVAILTRHFGPVEIKAVDREYKLPDNGKVAELSGRLSTMMTGLDAAKKQWDCDDYAIAAMVPLRNYAFGTMYVKTESGRRHALNVFINRNKEIVYWEPQTNDYYKGRFYKPDLIIF
ncbi:MAG: hypothetical protein Kow0089_24520 [Desulfobulbaceae bacterium]